MTIQVLIPAKAILGLQTKTLDLTSPKRCSRCNTSSAPYFETHQLRYKADLIPNRQVDKRFRTNISFRLRLPVCEKCYQAGFTEAPESFTHDSTPLGIASRWRSLGIKIAALITGIGFILLMKVIPLPEDSPIFQYLWLIIIAASLLLFGIIFGLTALKIQSIKKHLGEFDYSSRFPRAVVYEAIETEKPDPSKPAIFLSLVNKEWAKECADNNGWKFESTDSQAEKEKRI